MWEEILRAIPVYLSSMLKFILGPVGGYLAGLTLTTTILTTVAGMMTVVVAFTFFGDWLRDKIFHRFFKNSHPSDRFKRFSNIWKKYGIVGVAILTPLLLTPIGGTLLAISLGTPKDKLIFYMFISAAVWSVTFSAAVYFFGNEIVSYFVK
jgi:membrane protein DedA with SNARE-associated domain